MDNCLISIIVVTYNSEKTVIKTLDSVKKQTYKNIEIVVSDDCSTDSTINTVLKWQKNNYHGRKMRVICGKHNTGISENVNRGIIASSGELIKIIAGDDTLENNAIEVFLNNYNKYNNPGIIFQSKVNLIDENDMPTDSMLWYAEKSYKYINSSNQFHNLVGSNFIVAPAIGLIHKSVFEQYGYFDKRFPMLEDYPFYLKLSKAGFEFRLIEDYLVNYRITQTSVSKSKGTKKQNKYKLSNAKFYLYEGIRLQIKEKYYKKALISAAWSLKTIVIETLFHRSK